MEKVTKILLNNETWRDLEQCSNKLFFSEKLQIGNDIITVVFDIGKKTNTYAAYINGVIKGKETEENEKKYWFEKKKRFTKNDIEYHKIMIKRSEGEEKKQYQEKLKSKVNYSWYTPCFSSFKSFMSTYKKRHKEIYWLQD